MNRKKHYISAENQPCQVNSPHPLLLIKTFYTSCFQSLIGEGLPPHLTGVNYLNALVGISTPLRRHGRLVSL